MDRRMTVVFIGFDGYSDLWDDCLKLYKKYWDDNPFQTFFINNEKEFFCKGIEVLHAGKDAEWSRKVQLAIQKAETPYICLLLEDFFVGKNINTKAIRNTLSFIEKEKIQYYKLVNMSRLGKNHDPNYKKYKFLHTIPESDEYGVSLQAAIWHKDYLRELVGTENYNAWKFEFARVKESQGKLDYSKLGCVFDERNILNLQHGVIQGRYLPGTIKYFRKRGVELNIERQILPWFQYYKMMAIPFVKQKIPKKYRNSIKKILEKFGMQFVSTVRDKEES